MSLSRESKIGSGLFWLAVGMSIMAVVPKFLPSQNAFAGSGRDIGRYAVGGCSADGNRVYIIDTKTGHLYRRQVVNAKFDLYLGTITHPTNKTLSSQKGKENE
jgi:hypothetical protein